MAPGRYSTSILASASAARSWPAPSTYVLVVNASTGRPGRPRPDVLAEPDVVEPDDGQVLGHPDAMRLGRGEHAERDVVAGHERRGRRVGRGQQVRQRAHPELLGELASQADLARRVDARLGQRVEVAAVAFLDRAELAGPGHERDPAVPERRQVAGRLTEALER
jgi:hypothetical protein